MKNSFQPLPAEKNEQLRENTGGTRKHCARIIYGENSSFSFNHIVTALPQTKRRKAFQPQFAEVLPVKREKSAAQASRFTSFNLEI